MNEAHMALLVTLACGTAVLIMAIIVEYLG